MSLGVGLIGECRSDRKVIVHPLSDVPKHSFRWPLQSKLGRQCPVTSPLRHGLQALQYTPRSQTRELSITHIATVEELGGCTARTAREPCSMLALVDFASPYISKLVVLKSSITSTSTFNDADPNHTATSFQVSHPLPGITPL